MDSINKSVAFYRESVEEILDILEEIVVSFDENVEDPVIDELLLSMKQEIQSSIEDHSEKIYDVIDTLV